MAVHLSRLACRQRQPARRPGGRADHFQLTSASVMNSFFVPQLGSMIYTMPGMATRLESACRQPGTYPGLSAQFSGDGFSDMRFDVAWRSTGRRFRRLGRGRPAATAQARRPELSPTRAAERGGGADEFRRVTPGSVRARREDGAASIRTGGRRRNRFASSCGGTDMLGKLTWDAIPLDQPIPLAAAGRSSSSSSRCSLVIVRRAGFPISGANGSPASITSGSA